MRVGDRTQKSPLLQEGARGRPRLSPSFRKGLGEVLKPAIPTNPPSFRRKPESRGAVQRGSTHYLTVNPSYVRLCKEPSVGDRTHKSPLLQEGARGRPRLSPLPRWERARVRVNRADTGTGPRSREETPQPLGRKSLPTCASSAQTAPVQSWRERRLKT